MNKVTRIIVVVVIGAVAGYLGSTGYGWHMGPVGFAWDNDRDQLERLTLGFLDDLRFKDFKKAATYHSASDQAAVDIPALIEAKFAVKPELLDIQEAHITRIEVDSDHQRAKTVTSCHVAFLNTHEIKDLEAIFYWQKDETGRWRMQLKSSL